MKTKHYAFLLFAVACASQLKQPKPTPKTVDVINKPETKLETVEVKPLPVPTVIVPEVKPREWRTPIYSVAISAQLETYKKAIEHIKNHANTDAFYAYMKSKRKYFAHAKCKVDDCIKQFREQLDQADIINVVYYTPFWKSAVIGGWDGSKINDNTKFLLTDTERAGHILHETAHKYGWIHIGNYTYKNDNINSFPYAVGDDFEAYLKEMEAKKVAGSK